MKKMCLVYGFFFLIDSAKTSMDCSLGDSSARYSTSADLRRFFKSASDRTITRSDETITLLVAKKNNIRTGDITCISDVNQ